MGSDLIGKEKLAGGSSRRRDSLFLRATALRPADGGRFDIVVRNLSAGGLLADAPPGLAPGDRVVISLRRAGEVAGRVAWVQASRFGVAFDSPIDPAPLLGRMDGDAIGGDLAGGGLSTGGRLAPRRGRSSPR